MFSTNRSYLNNDRLNRFTTINVTQIKMNAYNNRIKRFFYCKVNQSNLCFEYIFLNTSCYFPLSQVVYFLDI